MEPAQVLFDYVRRKREEARVDRACVTAVCEAVRALPAGLPFSINVHAATLSRDPEFLLHLVDCASGHSIEPARITIEIVEHAPEWADQTIAEALDAARHIGLRIALDDIGLGQSNYRMMLDCKPDYFKIDRYFVAGCHADYYRAAVLESVSRLAQKFGALVVAEGVEEAADLHTAMDVGIGLFQGYLFSKAVSGHALPSDETLRGLTPTSRGAGRTGHLQASVPAG